MLTESSKPFSFALRIDSKRKSEAYLKKELSTFFAVTLHWELASSFTSSSRDFAFSVTFLLSWSSVSHNDYLGSDKEKITKVY